VRITLRADGPAALDLVWRRWTTPELWTQWAPQIRRVESSAPQLEVGVTGTVYGVVPNLGARWEVVEYCGEEFRWAWDAFAGPVRMHLEARSEARIGGGTSTTLVADGPAAAVITYAPVARIDLEGLLRRPKA
jgi:hypothetical protein